jgi:hypothetical protein
MRHSFRFGVAVSLLIFVGLTILVTGTAYAQSTTAPGVNSATRGGLGGTVYDSAGAVMPGISVSITGPQGNYEIKTDQSGRYELTGLIPGSYKVVVETTGFKKYVADHNQVVVDHTANLDIHLALGAVTDTVSVEAGAVQIDTSNTSLNAPISDELYESIPVARNVAAIFSLAPGVVSGGGTGNANPSIGGATGLENLYLVDGVTITDQAFGGLGTYNRFFGSVGTGVNLAFIKEVDVKTGAFEPKYGRADGGIVEIVTKSGSTQYHGALAAYFGPGSWYASRYQPSSYGFVNYIEANYLSNPQYDIAAEFGGPVPGLKNKMFFFGAFDPSLNQDVAEAPVGTPLASHGPYAYSATTLSWASKLTWQPWMNTQIEASTFGDPAHHNQIPGPTWETGLAAASAASVGTRYNYGSRDSVGRISQAITPSWTVLGVFTYNFNHFDENPLFNRYEILDHSKTPFVTTYIGGYEPTKNDDYSINAETQKRVHFLGEHTLSLGYTYDHTNFLDQPSRTGSLFAMPTSNIEGASVPVKSGSEGKLTNAVFRLYTATEADGSVSTACSYCAMFDGNPVYLDIYRGTWEGLSVQAAAHYHVGWVNDSYQINRHLTLNAGLRWEEQWYAGDLLKFLFNDNWSPRLGFNYDPWGDQKSKVFFNYARYQLVLPLDAAIRQLGNEQDDTHFYFTPKTDGLGNAVLDENGAVTPVLDNAHTLNGTQLSSTKKFAPPTYGSSTGEGILPGTKMEYENEYVLGIERQVTPGSVLQMRYSDRRLGRIVEDIGSNSPELSIAFGAVANYFGGIANPTAKTDVAVNEDVVTYTPDQWNTANGSNSPGTVTAATYVAPVAGCTYSTDYAVANGDFFRKYDGSPYNSGCVKNLATADAGGADGKPDGFVNPIRRYQELVVEYNRNLKNHWQGRANYRYARLWGNYEGLFRNDNGQSDPGISSLFDFTAGELNLLGDQFKPGFLNTDRRNVFNMNLAYTAARDSRFVSFLNKTTVGANLRFASGNPLSALASHPAYGNTGEVPIGGRGTKGSLPHATQVDAHLDYPLQMHDKYTFKFAFDAFNIFNSQFVNSKNQNLDTAPGSPSVDYGKPLGFQGPFYARASIRFEF